jgi:4-hydroxy-tetrahydrodipicolinate synthase
MGTTGESPTVTHDENIAVIEIVAKQAAGKVEIIAGTGSNATAEAVRMTRLAARVGATATLQVAPYYNKPSQEGFYRHFSTIADETGLPMVVYNIPGRTAKNIENSTMLRLAQHPHIVGVKEASGSLPQVMDLVASRPDSFTILSGDDNLTLPLLAVGGNGVVSVASNIAPALMVELVRTGLKGDFQAAREIHYRLLPLFRALFFDTNPVPIKYALASRGNIEEVYRLPLCSMTDDLKKQADAVLKEVNPS